MAGQVQFDLARRLATVRVGKGAFQVGVGQHPAAVVAQANARVGEVGFGAHGLHVDQRIAGFTGRVALHAAHGGMIHTTHLAVIHAGHGVHATVAHVGHGQDRPRVGGRHRRAEPGTAGQGAAGVTGAVHALGIQGIGRQVAHGHQHVVGFGHGDAQFVDADRLHRHAIGGDYRQLQAGDAEVEIAHRRAVDQAQAHGFTRLEQTGEVAVRRLAVEQVGVGCCADVGKVGRAHAHFGPALALSHGFRPAVQGHVIDEITDCTLVVVEGVGLLFQGRHQRVGGLVAPVAEQQHIVALIVMRFGLFRLDDDCPVYPGLFLQAGMAVVPVGAALLQGELIEVIATGFDTGKAQARDSVHVGRQDDAVPVQRGGLVQAVAYAQRHGVAFAPA
ncbi:hypothetical protein D3C77_311930 [compost metagenome]